MLPYLLARNQNPYWSVYLDDTKHLSVLTGQTPEEQLSGTLKYTSFGHVCHVYQTCVLFVFDVSYQISNK